MLSEDRVVYLKAIDKVELLKELHSKLKLPQRYLDAILCREAIGTTGIGRGFALPSAVVDIDKMFLVLGISKQGINFNSLDFQNVHFVLLLLRPMGMEREFAAIQRRVAEIARTSNISKLLEMKKKDIIDFFNTNLK